MSQQSTTSPTSPTTRPQRRVRAIAGVAAALALAFVLGVGAVLLVSHGTPARATYGASNPATAPACPWMTNWPSAQAPSAAWCAQMTDWAQGHLGRNGMMTRQPGHQAMYDACITTMTNTRGITDPKSWCQQMATWMAGHWSDHGWMMGR